MGLEIKRFLRKLLLVACVGIFTLSPMFSMENSIANSGEEYYCKFENRAKNWVNTTVVTAMSFDSECRYLAAASANTGKIRIFDLSSKRLSYEIGGYSDDYDHPEELVMSPDGNLVISISDEGELHVWNLRTRALDEELTDYLNTSIMNNAISCDFSPDGMKLVINAGKIIVWDIDTSTGQISESNMIYNSSFPYIEFLTNEILCLSSSKGWKLFDFSSQTIIFDVPLNIDLLGEDPWPGEAYGFSAHLEREILVTSHIGYIGVWDLKTGSLIRRIKAYSDLVVCSSNERYLISTESVTSEVHIWDIMTGQRKHQLAGHTSFIRCIELSPNEQFLATGDYDGTIIVWEELTVFRGKINYLFNAEFLILAIIVLELIIFAIFRFLLSMEG